MMKTVLFGLIALVLVACTASPAAQKRAVQQTQFFNRVMNEGNIISVLNSARGYEYTVNFNKRMYKCTTFLGSKNCSMM